MAKDPAFLLYTSDFLTETYLMTNDQVGKFIRLLCLQHQIGFLTKDDILQICEENDKKVLEKFVEIAGKFYHLKTKEESERRKKFNESRRKNRQSIDLQSNGKNICEPYVEHMETETETITNTKTNIKIGNENFNWESVKKYFLSAEDWMYQFSTSKSVSRETLIQLMNEFINEMELRNEFKELKELQRHFTNWFNKSQKQNKNGKLNKNSGRDELLESLRQKHPGNNIG